MSAQAMKTVRSGLTSRSYWTAVWCGFLVLTIGLGVRQSFGIFLKPVSVELHVGRELFSFGTAVSLLLMGAVAPFAGRLCDRFGSAITIAGGAASCVFGMIVTANDAKINWRHVDRVTSWSASACRRRASTGAGRDPRDAASQGSAGDRHLLGWRLVGPSFIVLASVLQNYWCGGGPRMGFDGARRADDAVADRRTTASRSSPHARRMAATRARWAGVQPEKLRAAGRLLSVVSTSLFVGGHPRRSRQGHRAVVHGGPCRRSSSAAASAWWPVQHRGLDLVELDGRPTPAQNLPRCLSLRSLVFLGLPRALVGGIGADLAAALPCGWAPCRSPPRWSVSSSAVHLATLNGVVFSATG
jgi:hypothetical protein